MAWAQEHTIARWLPMAWSHRCRSDHTGTWRLAYSNEGPEKRRKLMIGNWRRPRSMICCVWEGRRPKLMIDCVERRVVRTRERIIDDGSMTVNGRRVTSQWLKRSKYEKMIKVGKVGTATSYASALKNWRLELAADPLVAFGSSLRQTCCGAFDHGYAKLRLKSSRYRCHVTGVISTIPPQPVASQLAH